MALAERFHTLISALSVSRLSSRSLVIPPVSISWESGGCLLRTIRFAPNIVRSIKGRHMQEVRMVFKPDPIASLGYCLSSRPRPLKTCDGLDKALLAFPHPRIALRHRRRAQGRTVGVWVYRHTACVSRAGSTRFISFPDRQSHPYSIFLVGTLSVA